MTLIQVLFHYQELLKGTASWSKGQGRIHANKWLREYCDVSLSRDIEETFNDDGEFVGIDSNVVTVLIDKDTLYSDGSRKKFENQLSEIILEAQEKLKEYFGNETTFFLSRDIDDNSTYPSLVLEAGINLEADEALKIQSKFDTEWWMKVVDKTQNKLVIGLRYL